MSVAASGQARSDCYRSGSRYAPALVTHCVDTGPDGRSESGDGTWLTSSRDSGSRLGNEDLRDLGQA